jgi:hypothetical protein
MKTYKNFDEIELDLKRLNLERQIAWEELKGMKREVEADLSPYRWISTFLSVLKKYGFIYFVRKVLR